MFIIVINWWHSIVVRPLA